MIIKCAWCGQDIKTADEKEEKNDFPVSHGICSDCAIKMLKEINQVESFINRFKQPIMLVDNINNTIILNDAARAASHLDFAVAGTFKCGLVLGCVHADEPEGCGNTIHCQGCVINRAIKETEKTGKPYIEEACADEKFFVDARNPTMIISTEKLGDRILLKIDPIKKKTE